MTVAPSDIHCYNHIYNVAINKSLTDPLSFDIFEKGRKRVDSDKRRNSRLKLDLTCMHEHFKAQINDISVSGIQFISERKLEKNSITELDIVVSENDFFIAKNKEEKSFRLEVKVMWCKKELAGLYTVGAKILTSTDEAEKLFLIYLLNNSGEKFAQLDRKLLEMEAYETLVVNATYPISVVQDEKIIFINPAWTKLMGYKEEESMGKKFIDLLAHEDKKTSKETIAKHLSAKDLHPYMLSLIRKDGKNIDVEVRSENIQYRSKPAVMNMLRDVTKIKMLEQQLIQSEKLNVLGEIAGGVSHNFNNILGVILGRCQLLQLHLDKPDLLEKGLNIIEKAAQDGSEITGRLQDSIRARKAPICLSTVDINKIIKDVIDFTKTKWKDEAEAKGVTISIKTSLAELPPVTGNASELREVFINLVFNSIDAIPMSGQIQIKTAVSGPMVSISFSDSGEGMPEEVISKVFDPFFSTKGQKGTGLGMSLSNNIVSKHRGEISVESTEGEGTTFTILLPIQSEEEKSETTERTSAVPADLKTANILVVDDDEHIRDVFFDFLTYHNHCVSLASNGKEALALFKTGSYDTVITDLAMHGMSGLELAGSIKDINPKTPVILMTGWNPEINDNTDKQRNVDFEMMKPFSLDQMLDIVTRAMKLRKPGIYH